MRLFLLSTFFLAIDLLSKFEMHAFLENEKNIPIIGEFFRLELHKNTGISFSLPVPWEVQIVLSLLFFGAGIFFLKKHPPKGNWETFGIALIIGGALGNFGERLLFGEVTDFLAVWKLPVFNLADSFLFCGVALFLWLSYFSPSYLKNNEEKK